MAGEALIERQPESLDDALASGQYVRHDELNMDVLTETLGLFDDGMTGTQRAKRHIEELTRDDDLEAMLQQVGVYMAVSGRIELILPDTMRGSDQARVGARTALIDRLLGDSRLTSRRLKTRNLTSDEGDNVRCAEIGLDDMPVVVDVHSTPLRLVDENTTNGCVVGDVGFAYNEDLDRFLRPRVKQFTSGQKIDLPEQRDPARPKPKPAAAEVSDAPDLRVPGHVEFRLGSCVVDADLLDRFQGDKTDAWTLRCQECARFVVCNTTDGLDESAVYGELAKGIAGFVSACETRPAQLEGFAGNPVAIREGDGGLRVSFIDPEVDADIEAFESGKPPAVVDPSMIQ